jgi:glycosyltransferase involved in cell wall biosynthesis
MRVLQALAGAPHGGAEKFFERLVPALAAHGVEQRVLIRTDARRAALLAGRGIADIRQLAFGNRFDIFTRFAFRAQIETFRPDLVFTWMSRATQAAPASPCKGHRFVRLARLGGYYDLKYYRGCDHLVGDTQRIVDYLVANGWPAERASYIPNFVADGGGKRLPRAELFVPETAPLLLSLGRLHVNKGFDVLLKALVEVPEAYLLMAGIGPLRAELERLAVKLGVRPRVRFLGWREDVADLLATADLFVHPARHEPLGNVILEAWSQRRAVVCTAAEGPASLIEQGENGVLVPVDQPPALAVAIRNLLADPYRRDVLAAGGRKTYERNFTEGVVVGAYRDLFERILR